MIVVASESKVKLMLFKRKGLNVMKYYKLLLLQQTLKGDGESGRYTQVKLWVKWSQERHKTWSLYSGGR